MRRVILKPTIQSGSVYALIDPRNNQIKYIGVSKNPWSRMLSHLEGARKNPNEGNKHKRYWLKQLLDLGLKPEVLIIETCDYCNPWEAEIWWIDLLRQLNYPLTNIAKGGDKPPDFTGRHHTEKYKKNHSRFMKQYWKENIHPSKGKSVPKEWVEKVQASRKRNGTKSDPTNMLKKRINNPDWYKNMSEAAKKRFSEPTNNVMYGKKHTELSKRKNSLGQKLYHANRKGDYFLLSELQEDWLKLTGSYHPVYSEFAMENHVRTRMA